MTDSPTLYGVIRNALRGHVRDVDLAVVAGETMNAVHDHMAKQYLLRPTGGCPGMIRGATGTRTRYYCVFDFDHTGAHRDDKGVTWQDTPVPKA